MMIDTHAHLIFSQYDDDLVEVLQRAKDAGISKIVNVGCTLEDARKAIAMADEFDGLFATIGMHPIYADQMNDEVVMEWGKMLENNDKIVAIGECGLDYFKTKVSVKVQKNVFRSQLEFAVKHSLPIIVHCRDEEGSVQAYDDCLEILGEFDGADLNVVFHCYSGTLEYARKIWERGYFISFTGVVTYKNAASLREVVSVAPLDRFFVETDCPFLAPQKYRGERNEPAYASEVVKFIAELKGMDFDEVAFTSTNNAELFFRF